MTRGQFKSTQDAIMFALNFPSQQYAQAPLSKLIPGTIGNGMGLVGNDGAGQVGMILAAIGTMDPLHRACITARYSPKFEKCGCCGGKKPLQDWQEAIKVLQEWSASTFSGLSHRDVREAIILNFYDRGASVTDAASYANVPRKTAYNQRTKIHVALAKLDAAAQMEVADILECKRIIEERVSR